VTGTSHGSVDVDAAVRAADGSPSDPQRTAAVRATLAGRRAIKRQQRVVHALRAAAPATPPHLRAALAAAAARPARRRRRYSRPLLAGALAATLTALALLAPGPVRQAPSALAALELASRPPTAPAPPPHELHRQVLARDIDGVPFPNWAVAKLMPAPHTGWTATGARSDELQSRRAETVFYEHDGHHVAYSIVSGPALEPPAGARRQNVAGHRLWTLQAGNRDVVVFERRGRTCIVSGDVRHATTLLRLATWRGDNRVTF
jgi:hypothetical protein